MNWNSFADFVAMGGYGTYVWGSFGACVLAFVLEPLAVGRRAATALHGVRLRAHADSLDKEFA